MDRLDLLVGEVRNVGGRKLGFNGDSQSCESSVLVGKSLVELCSPGGGLTKGLVVAELSLVFLDGSLFTSAINPFDTDGNLCEQFVAFGGFHEISEFTSFTEFFFQFVSVSLKFVSGTFPVKELVVRLVEGQFLLTESFLLLGRDSVRRGIELNSGMGSATSLFSLVLLLLGSSIFVHGRTNGHLLHFSPTLGKLSTLELGNLIEVVLDLDNKLSLALSILVLKRSFSNVVASQLGGETLHELGKVVRVLVIVEEETHVSEFVLEGETLGHGEVRTDGEKFHGLLDIGFVSEVVGDTEWKCVVVLNSKTSGGKGGRKHSSLHGGSLSDTLKGLEGTEKLFLLENFLKNLGDDRSTSAIAEEFN